MHNTIRYIRCVAMAVVLVAWTGITAAANNDPTANLAARLAKLERALDNRGLVDLLEQVERLQAEVQLLRGQIEEQSYTIAQLRKTQRETYVDLDSRLQSMQSGGTMIGPAATGVPPLTTLAPGENAPIAGTEPATALQVELESAPGAPPLPTAAAGEDELGGPPPVQAAAPAPIVAPTATIDNEASEAAYRDAFTLLKAGKYDESIGAFQGYLAQFPNSQYADNAQYWLGETYYVKREFEPALIEYRKLVENYPASKKQSHAMLKIGYSYHELGQLDQARAVLEDLRHRFPGTTAARLAEERIAIIGRQP